MQCLNGEEEKGEGKSGRRAGLRHLKYSAHTYPLLDLANTHSGQTLNGSEIPNGSNADRSEGFPENRFDPLPEKNGSLLEDVGAEKAENRSLPPLEPVVPNGSFFLSSLVPPPAPPPPLVELAATASEDEDCGLSSAPSSR